MPADNPLVGETWEMTDPATGQAAQAVVTEATPQAIRLVARLGRHLAMPRRSFLMTWHFVQEAPAQVCAHGACEEPAYLQVNDLGNWVWVCPNHLPAHIQPLLPTDTPGDPTTLDQCPVCRASAVGAGEREVESVTIRHCESCDSYWVFMTGEGDPDDETEHFENGLRFGEALQDVAHLLESDGLAVRALIGPIAWDALRRTTGDLSFNRSLGATSGPSNPQFAGVELTTEDSLGNSLALIGERPRTGVQRLGGQPDRSEESELPEEGSVWTNTKIHLRVDRVSLATQGGQGGQRLVVYGTVVDVGVDSSIALGATAEYWVGEFVRWFHRALDYQLPGDTSTAEPTDETGLPQADSTWWEKRTYRRVVVQKATEIRDEPVVQFSTSSQPGTVLLLKSFFENYSAEPLPPPCAVNEEWEPKTGSESLFRIREVLESSALVSSPGEEQSREVPFYILTTRYKKTTRRSALERIMDDD